MAVLYPNTKSGKIAFFNSKTAPWTAAPPAAIGTSAGAVSALSTAVTNAIDKLAQQVAAEQAFKTATAAADNAIADMVVKGADIIKSVRAFAASSTNPAAVYELAEIPAPATPTPVTTLGAITQFVATLAGDGSLDLKWKCRSPRATGVIYQVWRQVDGESDFSFLNGVGEKKYTDGALPAGASMVLYKIQAVRSTATGPIAIYPVLIGTSASGQMTATVQPPKLAA